MMKKQKNIKRTHKELIRWKAQSTVEYLLLFAAVIAVLLIVLGPTGLFHGIIGNKYDQIVGILDGATPTTSVTPSILLFLKFNLIDKLPFLL